jgi:hypothetical protein
VHRIALIGGQKCNLAEIRAALIINPSIKLKLFLG